MTDEKIVTHGPKYMGSKKTLLPVLRDAILKLSTVTALDVFSGTTRVAQMLRASGVRVTTSDIATYSRVFSGAWVSSTYDQRIVEYHAARLSRLDPVDGWFTRTYCDVPSSTNSDKNIRFMTRVNGMRVDAIRLELKRLLDAEEITYTEHNALVATLIVAMDRVDNTVAIQQSYLRDWCTRSKKDLRLQVYAAPMGPVGTHIQGDVLNITYPSADIAYLDPPYTAANYQTNYHIWETIARGDEPEVTLMTNRRKDFVGSLVKNPWCSAKTIQQSLESLLLKLDVGHIVVSYGSASIMTIEQLCDVVTKTHDIEIHSTHTVNENIMSKIVSEKSKNNKLRDRAEHLIIARSRS